MSYLHLPRLTFSGDFVSDVSTVNNDPQHYNNATFDPTFQLPGQGQSNGWWNPEGGATFGFQNCKVMQVTAEDGTIFNDPNLDGVIGQIVTGAEGRNSGKMVDLDPDQQMVSALWGVTFRILSSTNELLLEGKIKPTSFRDLQMRQTNGGKPNGQPLGGTWTSVIEDVIWGEKAMDSYFLRTLRTKTQNNKISINLNAFGYYYTHEDGRFSLGRILGSIGPWYENEPELFAPARKLYGVYKNGSVFSGSNFLCDVENGRLSLDLGSSFPVSDSIGTIDINADFYLAVSKYSLEMEPSSTDVRLSESSLLVVGKLPYQQGVNWLNSCSGIVDFNNVPINLLEALKNNQLVLVVQNSLDTYTLIAREAIGGYVCRADNFVQRIDAGETVAVDIYAYQFGNPLQNQKIAIRMEPATADTPKEKNNPPICATYGNNKPQNGLAFNTSCTTNAAGLARLEIRGNSIYSPRVYIDGQIYWVDYALYAIPIDPAMPSLGSRPMPIDQVINQNMAISIHLRDYFSVPDQPNWPDHIAPIMTQFANLYPIMSKYFINFADPHAVIAKKDILKFAFTRNINDPIYMPVTRDLSKNKLDAILKWLDNPILESSNLSEVNSNTKSNSDNNLLESSTLSTEYQDQLKIVNRAKNGGSMSFPELTNLFEF